MLEKKLPGAGARLGCRRKFRYGWSGKVSLRKFRDLNV